MTWTQERIAALSTAEIRQLRANADRLRNQSVVDMCDEVLSTRPKLGIVRRKGRKEEEHRRLMSRSKAFAMRGVKLRNSRWSWGGVRTSDGMVVFTVWAADVQRDGQTSRYMLFGPDRGGDRPWADTPGGKERAEHCKLALKNGEAEGILIYGDRSLDRKEDDLKLQLGISGGGIADGLEIVFGTSAPAGGAPDPRIEEITWAFPIHKFLQSTGLVVLNKRVSRQATIQYVSHRYADDFDFLAAFSFRSTLSTTRGHCFSLYAAGMASTGIASRIQMSNCAPT